MYFNQIYNNSTRHLKHYVRGCFADYSESTKDINPYGPSSNPKMYVTIEIIFYHIFLYFYKKFLLN